MVENDIEMKDLLGHPNKKDNEMSSAEKGIPSMEESSQQSRGSSRISRCHFFVIFISLFSTIFFGIEIFLYVQKTDSVLEPEKNESKSNHVDDEELENLAHCKPVTMAEAQQDCFNDPCFHFKLDPMKDCDWVAEKPSKRCDREYTAESLVRDHCPVSCGACDTNPLSENNAPLDYEMTIVDGVDDKDVYCEDLSQYDAWHNTKVSKDDGIMFNIVRQMDHDPEAFTQGLTYARGTLFESAGLYGHSDVRILDRTTALVEKKEKMDAKYFAEGITYYKDKLVQITWKLQQGFVYDINTLEEIDRFKFETTVNQGWGITWDRCKDELIVTDGSSNIHFWDPNTFQEIRRVKVTRMDGSGATNMNEIEFWRGRVLANVWYEDVILVINPETGVVEKEYDFSTLWPKSLRKKEGADVLNGISISEHPEELYVTGKKWNRMFTIQLLPEL